jgi:hypothetical protein
MRMLMTTAVAALVALVVPATALAGGVVLDGYPAPQSASPTLVSLVPSFIQCTAPNRQHGPPLAHPSCGAPPECPSCGPPFQTSGSLTVGTPDFTGAAAKSVGFARWKVVVGTPGLPDDSDVVVEHGLTDARCGDPGVQTCGLENTVEGPDYTGEVELRFPFRLTDRFNAVAAGGGPDPATMIDITFPITFQCASTPDTSIGGTCHGTTTLNAVVPGSVKDAKRAIWEFGQITVFDGGSDGQTATTPNTQFASQGIFVP